MKAGISHFRLSAPGGTVLLEISLGATDPVV